ncbi:DNA methyltransferase [Nitratiruptor sp. YY09-18]|uniref:DNA methyltransferase n=1 Tax=Nitratiruptor sp. YY09-18 TaxID=2724901 RepID=UPI0019154D89|nr:DNA methyltransferase [Nitratiruptor sp. YY09-18]BCD67604.1 adenine-specific DNA-methyltransferase [Nitratiruptor sp. YY09-18]
MEKNINHNNPFSSEIVAKQKKDGGWNIYEKYRKTTSKVKSIWDNTEIRTEEGTRLIRELFEKSVMDHPKSLYFIKKILELSASQNDIVLDFFSGSATTAHAVMELNAEDGGNRQFIMIQIPELIDEKSEAYKAGFRTIAEIGRERIIRATNKIKNQYTNNQYTNIPDFGFRYFKVDTSNFKENKDISEISQENIFEDIENIKLDRTELDLLFEVILNLRLELTLEIEQKEILGKKVYFIESNSLIACFDENIDENLAKELVSYQPLKVVLKDSSFKSDSDKINFEQIFKEQSPETDIWVV